MVKDTETIVKVETRAVVLPFKRPVQTASFAIPEIPLVLIDIHTSSGVIGRAYVLAFSRWVIDPMTACIRAAAEVIKDQPLAPAQLNALLRQRFMLLGTTGFVGSAIGGVDQALWDAHARSQGVSLSALLGGVPSALPAYNSCGLWLKPLDQLADEASELIEEGGFNALKVRVGRQSAEEDLIAVQTVRDRVGDTCTLMVDYNQSLNTTEAIERAAMFEGANLAWIEDPVGHDNFEGLSKIKAAITTPLQTGENITDARKLHRLIAMDGLDLVMPDATHIGGVTGWLQAAAISDVHDIPMSSHIYPEFSRHLLTVTPTAHWLEYIDWANPILQEPVKVEGGQVHVPNTLGAGIEWDEAAIDRFLV